MTCDQGQVTRSKAGRLGRNAPNEALVTLSKQLTLKPRFSGPCGVRLDGFPVRLNASAAWEIAFDRAVERASHTVEGPSRVVERASRAEKSVCRVGKSLCRKQDLHLSDGVMSGRVSEIVGSGRNIDGNRRDSNSSGRDDVGRVTDVVRCVRNIAGDGSVPLGGGRNIFA